MLKMKVFASDDEFCAWTEAQETYDYMQTLTIIDNGYKWVADCEITCKRASTAIRRFLNAIESKYPETKSLHIDDVQDPASWNVSSFVDGDGWSYNLECIDDGRWYISIGYYGACNTYCTTETTETAQETTETTETAQETRQAQHTKHNDTS